MKCIYPSQLDLENYVHSVSGCSGYDFRDYESEWEFDSTDLNCVQCILEQYISDNAPQGMSLASITIYSSLLARSPEDFIDWHEVTICYGVPVIVPISSPGPFPTDISMLATTFSGKF